MKTIMRSSAVLIAGLVLICAGCGGSNSLSPAASGNGNNGGSTPQTSPTTTALPRGNVYNTSQLVVLQANRDNVTIRYTTDGSTPTVASSSLYSGALHFSPGKTFLKFYGTDAGGSETPHTETYTVVSGPVVKVSIQGTALPLSGMKVTLALPNGVTIPTNNDGTPTADAIIPSGNAYLAADVSTLAPPVYDPAQRTLSFLLVSSATGGFSSGEFVTVRCSYTGAAPAGTDFSATALEPTDLSGNPVSGTSATFNLIP